MDISVAGWLALIGFIAWIATMVSCLPPFGGRDERVFNEKSRRDAVKDLRIGRFLSVGSSWIYLLMILQGVHLLLTGYSIDISGMSGGGRYGWLILMIIQFLPYFLICGYGFILWTSVWSFNNARNYIRLVEEVDRFLLRLSEPEAMAVKKAYAKYLQSNSSVTALLALISIKRAMAGLQAEERVETPALQPTQQRFTGNTITETVTSQQELYADQSVEQIEQELKRIETLRQRGVVTEDEYQLMRRRALGI